MLTGGSTWSWCRWSSGIRARLSRAGGATRLSQLGTLKPGAKVTITLHLRVEALKPEFVNRAVAGTATQERTLANNVADARVAVRAPAPPPPGRG